MPPSRGVHKPAHHTTAHHNADEAAVVQQGDSALKNAKRNFNYLLAPSGNAQPKRFRTRALLRTFRYIGQFIFWRVVRWAKYAAVGAVVAAIGATAVGSVVTGAAWIAAPPTIFSSVIAASVWGVGKYMARKLHKRWAVTGKDEGHEARERYADSPVRQEGSYGQDMGPQAVPW